MRSVFSALGDVLDLWNEIRQLALLCIPMKSPPIPKQIGSRAEQSGTPKSRSEATLGFCT
jgi:hypothetical protein